VKIFRNLLLKSLQELNFNKSLLQVWFIVTINLFESYRGACPAWRGVSKVLTQPDFSIRSLAKN
jgi:hypothetical protein